MFLLFASFFAGVLTSLAPCILPLLPVIVGSSVVSSGDAKKDRKKPYIISLSLVLSVIAFTLLLKTSSLLIGVDPKFWLYVSGGIVVILGISMLVPSLWVRLSSRIGLEHGSNTFLANANRHKGISGSILTGAALGPVFSSCSPIYALILATVLPINYGLGVIYICVYALGLGLALLAIGLVGRRLTTKLTWAVNPSGWFRRVLAVILILVGLLVASGYDKQFQTWAAAHLPFTSSIEQRLLPKNNAGGVTTAIATGNKRFNVDPYPAPELQNIAAWINSSGVSLKDLRGKVVLIDFWTYSCINCQRTQPYLNSWYSKYHSNGFEIIGVHAPEFAFEKIPDNVRKAVKDDGIKYPVALDNSFGTWTAYKNQFWPAKYLIDKDGNVRFTHFGEGEYDSTEEAIQTLLKESGRSVTSSITSDSAAPPVRDGQTPETYLNYTRGERFANKNEFNGDKTITYHLSDTVKNDEWSLGGSWQIGANQTLATGDDSKLRIKFSAKEVYLVMDGPSTRPVTLTLNGKKLSGSNGGGTDVDDSGNIALDSPRLYRLVKLPEFTKNSILDISFPKGTTISAFTFGS